MELTKEQAAEFFASRNRSSKIKERNTKKIKKAINKNPTYKAMVEGMKRAYGMDITDEKAFPVLNEDFSWTKLRESLNTKLKEADTSGAFSQFLRAGIQTIVNNMYEATESTYEEWVTVVQSNKDTELYAPNHGVAFPREVGHGEKYPEVGAAALDIQLKNRKYGSIYALERELLEDDQSGSFQQQAGLMGEYMRLISEVWAYGKLASVAGMQYQDLVIPLSETQPSGEATYPYVPAAAPFIGGGSNRPAAYGALTQANIQTGLIGLTNQVNLQGIKMSVKGTRLLVGPTNNFDAAVLLNSAYYPSGAAAAGAVGGAFAINPIKGIVDLTVSRFMFDDAGAVDGTSTAWYLVDDTKPWFIVQLREPVSIEQENPQSGRSFDEDIMRYKGRTRMNADHIDPRFAWQGNDGSV
jgi:hypothetical protein